MPFLHVTPHPSSHFPQCSLLISFILEPSQERRAAFNAYHKCYLPLELSAGSCIARNKTSSRYRGGFYWTGNLIQKSHPCKHSIMYHMRDMWATDAHPIWMFHNKNVLKILPRRASLHTWQSSLVLFTDRRIKEIIILSYWIVYISSGVSLSLTCILKSKINVASATQWLWLTIICSLYWKSIVCMLPAVKLCNKQ